MSKPTFDGVEPVYGVLMLQQDRGESSPTCNARLEFVDTYNNAQKLLQEEYERIKNFLSESDIDMDIDKINEEKFVVATDQHDPLLFAKGTIVVANPGNISYLDNDLVDLEGYEVSTDED